MTSNLEKIKKHVSPEPSGWHEDAQKRADNEAWLTHSFQIAVKVLGTIRSKSITKQELADKIGVTSEHINRILKGQENLQPETIARLESTLGLSLTTKSPL